VKGAALFDALARDARYAARMLRRAPAFAVTAVVTLALAIAANTAVFSIVDAVLLKSLPYPEPDRLALVTRIASLDGATAESVSQNGLTWEAIRARAAVLDVAVYSTWTTGANLVAGTTASHVQQQRVGSGFFRVLGIAPVVGREFSSEEDRAGGPAAAILSHALWHSLFAGDRSAVGSTIELRGERATIVGVMPAGFRTGEKADIWTPLRAGKTGEGAGENYTVLARLRPEATWPAALGELEQIGAEVERSRPSSEGAPLRLSLEPLQASLASGLRDPLLLLWGGVAIVLVVACVNLSGLLLARGAGRTREIATRMALGSSRAIVIRQVLVESALLAVLGGLAGVVLGYWTLEGLKALALDTFDIWRPVVLDARAVVVAGVLALGASLVFGIVPAWQATRVQVQSALTSGGTRAIAGGSGRGLRRVLVVAQVALGVVLLAGAGLLVRTFTHLRGLDPGFDGNGVLTASVSLEDARYRTAERVTSLVGQTLVQLEGSLGIESAAVVLGLPYERLLNLGFRPMSGPEAAAGRTLMTSATYVSGDLFGTLRIPLRQGRVFSDRDGATSQPVAIVNEAFARAYFAGGALGHRIRLSGTEREIVGVVGDVQLRPGWGDHGPLGAMPLTYIPLAQAHDGLLRLVHGWFAPAFVVRAAGPREATVATVRRALDTADPRLPFARVRSMADVRDASLARQRLLMTLLVGLALAAVALAAIGIHGLIATSVTERTREVGIRLALGAGRPRVVRALMLPGLTLSLAGIALGGAAALAGARLLKSLVWGVSTTDPLTFVAVAGLLLAVATTASALPAFRILRLDPAKTLRES
jgi:predicted permease